MRLPDMLGRHQRFRRVFGSSEGQQVLKDILDGCYIAQSTYVGGDSDRTAFNEGVRAVGLLILKTLHKDPQEWAAEYYQEATDE